MLEQLVEIGIIVVTKIFSFEYQMQSQLLAITLLRVEPLPLVDEASPELFVQARFPSLRVELSLELLEVQTPDYFKVRQFELIKIEVIKRIHYKIVQLFRILQFCKLFLLLSVILWQDLQFLHLLLEDSQLLNLLHKTEQIPAQILETSVLK